MMRPRRHEPATESARGAGGRIADRHLRVVDLVTGDDVPNVGGRRLFERISSHILLAEDLGLDPLTIDERASAMLDNSCGGWRFDRRCRADGLVLDAPHPLCLRAQYHHDVLLLEHGLLDYERSS
jgi:hypothetical protein